MPRWATLKERFWLKVKKGTEKECWEWQGSRLKHGYGVLRPDGYTKVLAHRVAYELSVGPIPDGMWVLHSCDNKSCCNPAHLHPGTPADNMREASERRRLRFGEDHPRHKLTRYEVDTIKEMLNLSDCNQMAIAAVFGISTQTISRIKCNEIWRD